ncbi:MAG: exo-alpha-sialidase [Oscillospiraceae bacterium]|nr:exo-alpha-sialidase [Oscillospiraceae bacterium]
MKKATSFLLALVMVVSLLPGTAMTVSAAEEIAAPKQNNYYSTVLVNESFNNINTGITKGLNGTSADEQYTVQGSSSAQLKTGTLTEEGVIKGFASKDLATTAFDPERGFEVKFEATFNDLVVANTALSAQTLSGFIVDVRAASRCRYSFFADAAGNIYVTQYDLDAPVCFDTGADLGDKYVNVRIVVDDDMNSAVIVDGRYIGRFTDSGETITNNHFVLYTGTKNRVDDSRVNDVVLNDMRLTQAPVADELQAYYTFNAPYLDGTHNEANWPFDNGARVALLSDEEYLYIALNNSDPDPDFVINGVALTADPTTGNVTLSNGQWAGVVAKTGGRFEIKIPLKSVLGLDYAPGQKVGFTYSWDQFDGAVVLASRALVAYDGFEGAASGLGSSANEVYAVQSAGGSAITLKTGTYSAGGEQTLKHRIVDASAMAITESVTFEFTADFNDLVVPVVPTIDEGRFPGTWDDKVVNESSPFNWYAAGFGVEVRADPCRRYGFHADAEGNIYVTQRMNSYGDVTRVDTGIDVGATNVNVRLASDDTGVTTIYINGVPCAETLPAPNWLCPKTGGRGYYRFYNSTLHRDTATDRVNDVTLYNLMLMQEVPAPTLNEHPKTADSSVDMTAYLNPNGIKLDGVLNEAEWYTPYAVSGTGKAPGGLVGFAWGNGNLYVGGDTRAEVAVVRIAGQQVVANLRPYQAPLSGQYAASNSGFEWAIPLSRFGLPNGVLNESVSYEIILTNNHQEELSTLAGTLHFSGEQVLMGDTGRTYYGTDYQMGGGDGHIRWERSEDGYTVTAEGLNDLKADGSIYATGTFYREENIPVDYSRGAIELTMTATINDLPNVVETYGMRGLTFEIVGDVMRAVFALRKDENGNIWLDERGELGTQHCDTGVDVGTGEPVEFRFSMDKKQSISLYVNGNLVHSFDPTDRRDLTALAVGLPVPHFMIGVYNSDRGLNADGSVSVVDAVIHDLRLTKTPYSDNDAILQAALEQITQESIIGSGDPGDVTAMNLPTAMEVDIVGEPVSVAWSAIDTLTGRTAYGVDVDNGTVTRQTGMQAFNLKATVSYEGARASKTFAFQTKGTQTGASNVALIVNDDNPATGAATAWDGDVYAYLDNTHNSVVLDQGSSKQFNRIVLRDSDEYSRVSQRHLGVFVSDDGQNWTKVTGWMLHQSGRTYTLYNLEETARYVKVHCYHDDLDLVEGPTFYNKVADMIKVSNEGNLPGAYGKFAHSATFEASNNTAEEKKDAPVFVSLTTLGAAAGQYKNGCADFRFTIGDTTLAHWYNGSDGFYVRVPSIPAGGSTTVTAHWGCGMAEDYSDGEAVFEVTYGNVSLINLSRETYEASGGNLEKAMLSHGRPFTFPNGEIIVVARTMKAASNMAIFRSTDGGHTFQFDNLAFNDGDYVGSVAYSTSTAGATKGRSSGFGGYLWDGEHDENPNDNYKGRLFLLAYSGKGNNTSDYRIMVLHSDDYGRTWSEPKFLSLPGSDDIYKTGTTESAVSWLENSKVRVTGTEVAKRAITYCDGLVVKAKDANGNEFDRYVIMHSDTVFSAGTVTEVLEENQKSKYLRNATTAVYSDDGGETWYCSDTLISIPSVDLSRNTEDGTTEAGFAQLDDGRLRVVIRAQQEGNYYLYEGISEDYGKTWTADYSDVISSNTAPMLIEYGEDRLQMWSACTGLGQTSYRRTPLHLGLSTDEYESFDKIIDLTFATAFDTIKASEGRKTQTGMGISADGTSAFVSYYDQTWHANENAWKVDAGKFLEKGGTMGIAIEEFDQMVYGNKGAWDDFEDSSLKYQGWLVDAHGSIALTREQAVSGKYSMKVLDESAGGVAHALRQIPSLKSGTVGAKIMVPATNEAPFVMELKAAYNYDHMKFAVAAIFVTPSGSVGYVDADKNQHILTTVVAGSWNDYALTFDVSTGKGALYVNGKLAGSEFDLPDVQASGGAMHGVTAVQFNQMAATSNVGDCMYADDFFVNELPVVSRTLEEDTVSKTPLGRFMAIVRKIITMGEEEVEIVEWGWVPGL